jgi:Flp pilus assembly protein TadD
MKLPRRLTLLALVSTLVALGAAGCGRSPQKKEVSELDRKKAEHLASEAQFAMTLRNWTEAEQQLAQAAALDPNAGGVWLSLGSVRKRLGKTGDAKTAYQRALDAFAAEAAAEKTDAGPWLQQVYTLALLGRTDDARAKLAQTAKQFPNDSVVRGFIDGKQLDRVLADPKFKENAL